MLTTLVCFSGLLSFTIINIVIFIWIVFIASLSIIHINHLSSKKKYLVIFDYILFLCCCIVLSCFFVSGGTKLCVEVRCSKYQLVVLLLCIALFHAVGSNTERLITEGPHAAVSCCPAFCALRIVLCYWAVCICYRALLVLIGFPFYSIVSPHIALFLLWFVVIVLCLQGLCVLIIVIFMCFFFLFLGGWVPLYYDCCIELRFLINLSLESYLILSITTSNAHGRWFFVSFSW